MEIDDELAALLGTLVQAAQAFLKHQRGQFLPFAAFVNADGVVEHVGADVGVERPESPAVVAFLTGALRAMAAQGRARATGVCLNVGARLPGYDAPVDAICCFIESASGPPIDFYVPFRKRIFGYRYDKPIALPGTARIFGTDGGA